ncbi:MAG: hypothetical protein U0796_03710 [Gemmatales bacterium]
MLRLAYSLTFLVCCVSLTSAHAARLMKLTIEVDGQVYLVAHHTDDGARSNAEVWNDLRTITFLREKDLKAKLPADDALEWNLGGEVVLRIKHTSTILGEAKLQNLTMVRVAPGSREWTLKPEEVTRAGAIAGFVDSSTTPQRNELPKWFWYMGGIVIVLVLILGSKLVSEAQSNR